MAVHSSWKGYLKVSLVSIPLKAYTASNSRTPAISLNQLHKSCKSRIRYKKFCPIHGEVSADEIVSGYEYAKDRYAIIEPEELRQLHPGGDKSLTIDAFIDEDAVDSIYMAGQTYYLVPDGPVGQKPYSLLRRSLVAEKRQGIGTVVIASRERLVRIRPVGRLLAMETLIYASDIKQPEAFEDEIADAEPSPQELKLSKALVEAMTKRKLDLADYADQHTVNLTKLVEAKVEGKELVTPPAGREPQIINLMDALKESVRRVKAPSKTVSSVARVKRARLAAKPRTKKEPQRRRKSG
ncbi:MAG: Ku protein [Planctomycetaceae bacterium]